MIDIGINIPLILSLGILVMAGVNYYKSFYKSEIASWNARLASLVIALIIVYLVTYKTAPFVWQDYILNSVATALVASGYWDGTAQIGAAMAKAIAKIDTN